MNETLLTEIQNDAVDGQTDLPNLLRKCRILAQRIGNTDLKEWSMRELDGYGENELPEYRILHSSVLYGNYRGPYGTGVDNVQISASAIDEEFRDMLSAVHVSHGVSEIQAQIDSCPSGFLALALDQNIRGIIHYNAIASHLVLAEIHRQICTTNLKGLLDTVRNRILNFTLELEEFAAETGDPLKSLKEEHPREVQNVFNTHILGNVTNLNQGGDHVTQNSIFKVGDIEAVGKRLREIGLSPDEVDAFNDALISEPIGPNGTWGQRISAQFAKVIQKAAEGALTVMG